MKLYVNRNTGQILSINNKKNKLMYTKALQSQSEKPLNSTTKYPKLPILHKKYMKKNIQQFSAVG